MDGLSSAASGIAVVSLAVQLGDSVKKVCDFWASIKGASEEVEKLSLELSLVSTVLTEIAFEAQHVGFDNTLTQALRACSSEVRSLSAVTRDVEPGFASPRSRTRQWTALKVVLRQSQIKKARDALDRLKATLILAQQNQERRIGREKFAALQRDFTSALERLGSLSFQHSPETSTRPRVEANPNISMQVSGNVESHDVSEKESIGRDRARRGQSWTKSNCASEITATYFCLGTLRSRYTAAYMSLRHPNADTIRDAQDQREEETSYTLIPAQWLVRLGIRVGLDFRIRSSSIQGWQFSLKALCPVPDHALIFQYSKAGNIDAVRILLLNGLASVHDINSYGYNPLHYAAAYRHADLCNFLLDAAADVNAVTIFGETSAEVASHSHIPYIRDRQGSFADVLKTICLLTDSMDFSDQNGSGWEVCKSLSFTASQCWKRDENAISALLASFLNQVRFELQTFRLNIVVADILRPLAHFEEIIDVVKFLSSLSGKSTINTASGYTDEYTLLHFLVVSLIWMSWPHVVRELDQDLHGLAFDRTISPKEESPMSLAMYSSSGFMGWISAVQQKELDPDHFVREELSKNPSGYRGWDWSTLRGLWRYIQKLSGADALRKRLTFRYQNRPLYCLDCDVLIECIVIQPYWRHVLERIKNRLHPFAPGVMDANQEGSETGAFEANDEAEDRLAQEHNGDVDSAILQTTSAHAASALDLQSGLEPRVENSWKKRFQSPPVDPHSYPANVPIESECLYEQDEIICMQCWLHYVEHGRRKRPRMAEDVMDDEESENPSENPESDLPPDEKFSPYYIHT